MEVVVHTQNFVENQDLGQMCRSVRRAFLVVVAVVVEASDTAAFVTTSLDPVVNEIRSH